jgi:hypothetical protein
LEFFTLVSQELQVRKLRLWLDQTNDPKADENGYVLAPGGLFPMPIK